jgi:TRAP-type mannitol/chloroaromatic compound transport system permease small subunit
LVQAGVARRRGAARPAKEGGNFMEGLLALSRGVDRLNEIIGKWVSWLILVSILVSAGNAIIRKVFNISSNAWLELQWYLFGAAFMLAAAYTLKQNEHIRIDIVYGMWSRRVQHWIDLIGHLFFLMPFVLLMVYMFVPYTLHSFRSGEVSTNAGGLIIWPAKAILLVGFFLLALQGVSEIIKKIAIMRGEMDDPNPFVSVHEQAELEGKALADEVRS